MKNYKFQMLAVILIIFIGITLFSACVMSYNNLQIFKDNFYSENNFLDAYVDGTNLDTDDINNIMKIKGITEVEGRMELDGFISLPNSTNGVTKIIAYETAPKINKLKFVSGEYLTNDSQVLVSKNFAEFNKFKIGDTLTIKMLGKDINLTLQGIVESPEFIITIKSRDYVMPSIEDYGIVYVSNKLLQDNFSIPENSLNQIHLKVNNETDMEFIKQNIENMLGTRYLNFTERKDQISEVMAREDIGMISEIAYMFPIMFLFSAALVIFVMQKKLIEMQRTTIGVLKAIGYKNSKIISYYLKQSCILGTLGSVLSILPSYFMSIFITQIYCELVYIPISNFDFNWYVIGCAILMSNAFAICATMLSIKSLLKITAAEAMRTANISESGKNQLFVLGKKFKSDNKMVIRNLFRNPTRSFFTIVCYVIAFTLFAAPIFLNDSVKFAENSQYKNIQDYDYKIVFNQPMSSADIDEFLNKYDLNYSSLILEFPIEISNDGKEKTFRIIGVASNYSINDSTSIFSIPENGILLPKTISEQLNITTGESVNVKTLSQNSKTIEVIVQDTFAQYVGFSAYININELKSLMNLDENANGIYINNNDGTFNTKIKDIEEDSFVKRIDSVERERSEFNTLLNLVNVFILVMILFGLLMGFSSIYNSTMINVIDRRKEWGTLKVLGYSNSRILKMSVKETMLCYLMSLIPSILISVVVCFILGILMSNDFYTSPFIINYQILLYPSILGIIISAISVFIYYGSIRKINTSDVIKIKE